MHNGSHQRGNVRLRLILAIVVMVAGLGLAFRALRPVLWPATPSPLPPQLTGASERLGPGLLDTDPAKEPAGDVVSRAAGVARLALGHPSFSGVVGPRRLDDLVLAFEERLIATLDGEYERDMAARLARGMPPPPSPPSQDTIDNYRKTADWTRHTAIGIDRIEVRVIFDKGKPAAPTPTEEGFDALTYTKKGATAFPIPEDPSKAGLDVVEVRIPMALRPISGRSRGAVLVGYQFAWSENRQQWIPFVNVVYCAQGESYAILPF